MIQFRASAAAVICAAMAYAQPAPPSRPAEVAGIPVNYDENKVGSYTLPDPLVMADGKRVGDTKTWTEKRRPHARTSARRTGPRIGTGTVDKATHAGNAINSRGTSPHRSIASSMWLATRAGLSGA